MKSKTIIQIITAMKSNEDNLMKIKVLIQKINKIKKKIAIESSTIGL
jgi:hypothetical protein